MNYRKICCLTLLIIFLVTKINCFAAEIKTEENSDIINIEERIENAEKNGHRYAYISQGDSKIEMVNGTLTTNRWNTEDRGSKVGLYDFKTIIHKGKKAIESTATDQSNMFVVLEGNYWEKPVSGRLAITFEYIDVKNASLGVFISSNYHKLPSPMQMEIDSIRTTGTGEWKTYTYYLNDFVGRGIRVRVPSIQPFKAFTGKVPIGNVFIEEDCSEGPLAFDADCGYAGRILSYGNSGTLNVSYTNTINSKLNTEIKYNIRNYEGKIVYRGALPDAALEPNQSVNNEILTGVTDRGTYTLELIASVNDGNNISEYTKSLKFSVMDTLEEGEKRNSLVGVSDGISDNFYGGGYSGAEQLTRLPIGAVRLGGLDGISVETGKGEYRDPTLADRKYHSDNGVSIFALAYQMPSWYNGGKGNGAYPNTDEAHMGYANYAAYLAKLPYVDTIEMFNEWNHSGFSTLDQSADGYLEYCKVAYPAIKAAAKEAGKDVTVLAGGCAGFAANWIERFIKLGGLDYCDGLSYHPYQYRNFDYKTFVQQTQQVTKWMMDYHGSTKPITLTEMGIPEADDKETTNAGYEHWSKMRSLPGMYIMAQHMNAFDKIYYYCMHSTGYAPEEREPGFGLFEFVGNTQGNRLAALDSAITFAAYMDKLTGATPGRKIEADDYTKLAYEFVKENGEKIAALWSANQHSTLGINLGVKEVKVYDQFGNYKETLYSENGCFDFDLTDEIVYIEGYFADFAETKSKVTLSEGVIKGVIGDRVSFSVVDENKRNLKAELDYDSDVFSFDYSENTADGKITFNANLNEGVTGRYHIGLKLLDENGKTVYYSRPVIEITTEMINVSLDTAQISENNDRRWVVNISIKNLSATKMFNGNVSLFEPTEYKSERAFSELLPGEERIVKINLPEMVVKRPQQMSIKVSLDNGVEKTITQKLDFTSAKRVQKKPIIDGKVDKNEWKSTLMAEDRASRYATLINGTKWGGILDVSVNHKIMWDEDNFYMLAMVKDNVHYTAQTDFSSMWQDDGIQFGILENKEETLDSASLAFTELCISANPSGDKIYRHSSASGKPVGLVENYELKIGRENGYTIYEMRIPWTELLSDNHKAKVGDEYAFSFLINDNDGDGRKGYMYYNDGIGKDKLPSLFGKLRLVN